MGPSPGLPCISEHRSEETFLDPSKGPVDAFCLLVLDPDQVLYLCLHLITLFEYSKKKKIEIEMG